MDFPEEIASIHNLLAILSGSKSRKVLLVGMMHHLKLMLKILTIVDFRRHCDVNYGSAECSQTLISLIPLVHA